MPLLSGAFITNGKWRLISVILASTAALLAFGAIGTGPSSSKTPPFLPAYYSGTACVSTLPKFRPICTEEESFQRVRIHAILKCCEHAHGDVLLTIWSVKLSINTQGHGLEERAA